MACQIELAYTAKYLRGLLGSCSYSCGSSCESIFLRRRQEKVAPIRIGIVVDGAGTDAASAVKSPPFLKFPERVKKLEKLSPLANAWTQLR